MSDGSFQEKTEAPTPRRRKDAREKGKVPSSREITTAFLFFGGATALDVGAPPLTRTVVALFRGTVRGISAPPSGPDAMGEWLSDVTVATLQGLAPVLVGLAGLSLAVAGVQARGVLTLKPLQPALNRLSPLRNVKNIWGWRAPAELVKSLLKLAAVALAMWTVLSGELEEIPLLVHRSLPDLVVTIHRLAVGLLTAAGVAYLAVATVDYAFQLWRHEKGLRMSREEVKRERKESDGDPNVKARRRSMAQSLARRRMILAVSDADVVVTNPTHVAVALRWDPEAATAPVVLAMGERKTAERIKQAARDAGVPMVENRPVARALLGACRVGEPIPAHLYLAVAEILAFVFRNRSRGGLR